MSLVTGVASNVPFCVVFMTFCVFLSPRGSARAAVTTLDGGLEEVLVPLGCTLCLYMHGSRHL
jgi:hypothetical protein